MKKRKLKVGTKVGVVLISLTTVVLIVLLAAYGLFRHYYGKLDYDDGTIIQEMDPEALIEETDSISESGEVLPDSDAEVIAGADEELRQTIEANADTTLASDHVYNVLLVGHDSRSKDSRGRSDSMILVSINEETEEIIMTSIMRDCYVYIPGHGNSRINAAYAYGGGELLMETIETNFAIEIDNYAAINFYSFMEIVDAVGGVEITVSDAEVRVMNDYIKSHNELLGNPSEQDTLAAGGTYILNGSQALGYSRVRYVGNADYERTERQRKVLEALFAKVKDSSLTELNDLLNIVLPNIKTDIDENTMLGLLLNTTTDYKDYEIRQYRVPYDGTQTGIRVNGASVLSIDLDANIANMRRDIYGIE